MTTRVRDARRRRPPRPLLWAVVPVALTLAARAEAGGALQRIAQQAVQSLGAQPATCVVVAAPLASDAPAPRGDELATRLASLVAGRMRAGVSAYPRALDLAAARVAAGRAAALVYVRAEIARGDVRATLDVYPTIPNAWDRVRDPVGAPIGHAFAEAKVDAEVRAFLAPLALEQASVHRARLDEADVLAAACGDVDDDGGDEIALVSPQRVVLGRVRAGRFAVDRAAEWSELSARAPVPVRDPLGGAAIASGEVDVGWTDRGSVSLAPDFVAHTPVLGIPAQGPGGGVVCLLPEPSAGAFDGAPVGCTATVDPRPKMAVPAPRYDAFAAAAVVEPQGGSRVVVAVREPSGKIKLKMGDAPPHGPDGNFGAQLAVGDLDQDGVPEIVTSADGPDDAIDVWSWPSETADLRARLHLPAPGGVRALAVCPPEENGEPVLVAVVGTEIWLVRAGAREATGP